MSEQKSDATYTMGRTKEETERLIQQSGLFEDVTKRFLGEAGLFNGMKVLDIGSGAGDVAMAAAEFVGDDGEVVGVDVNTEILETARARAQGAGFGNIQFLAGDARTLNLPNDFDALIGRFVLMYMADPADALKRLKTRLRPGAIVAFQEADFTSISAFYADHTPMMNNIATWAVEVFKRSGAHTGMGFDLYAAFLDAGLPEPALRYTAPMGASEAWGGYQFVADTFRSILPLMEAYGIVTAEEVDIDTLPQRIRDEVVVSKRPVLLPPHVTAWAQLPS